MLLSNPQRKFTGDKDGDVAEDSRTDIFSLGNIVVDYISNSIIAFIFTAK